MASVLASCNNSSLQTVESGLYVPPPPVGVYKFERDGNSSVDLRIPEQTEESVKQLFDRFIYPANLSTAKLLAEATDLYKRGLYGYSPHKLLAQSKLVEPQRNAIERDFNRIIDSIAMLSGFGYKNPNEVRRREAEPGISGMLIHEVKAEPLFVTSKGLVLSESFRVAMRGAINLDQMLNVHLTYNNYTSEDLIQQQEAVTLVDGENYTELEMHWDSSWGHYKTVWQPYAQGDGRPEVRNLKVKLEDALVLGRIDMQYHLYKDLPMHVEKIKRYMQIMLVESIRKLLLGANTLANLNENPRYAFKSLSHAHGLIYALQFLSTPNDTPIFSYNEVVELQNDLLMGKGLWDTKRLLGAIEQKASLANIMVRIDAKLNTQKQ